MKNKKSLVITYYGNGKGKTTAAIGLALRAAGHKKKILIVQFIKGNWTSGEEDTIKRLEGVQLKKCGLGFVGLANDDKSIAQHREAAQAGFKKVEEVLTGDYDILILDEILGAIKGGLIAKQEVLKLIEKKPVKTTLVLTGAPKIACIIAKSDLVTQMKKIKHPYDEGILAIKGLDF